MFHCNCRKKAVVYECVVTTENEIKCYKGVTEGEAKSRLSTHKTSFNDQNYRNSSELSKFIWEKKENNREYQLQWNIIDESQPYKNGSKRCNLCTLEKLHIINADEKYSINKRSELVSKCRHENKFYLQNY